MAEFVEVMRQYNRMCEAVKGCTVCPLQRPTIGMCRRLIVCDPDGFEETVMKWAAEHPEKTMKDVLLEKFPKAMLRTDGMPFACVNHLGLGKCIDNCADHWRSPAPEE